MREFRVWYLMRDTEDDLNGDLLVAFESEALAAAYGQQLASQDRDEDGPGISICDAVFRVYDVISDDTVYVVNGGSRGPRSFWGIFVTARSARAEVARAKLEVGIDSLLDGNDYSGGMCIYAIKVRRSIYSGKVRVPEGECRLVAPPY